MEIVFARGRFLEPGPATVWMRPRVPLVEGEDVSALQRTMLAADGGNGVSAPLDWSRFIFINTDLTVHLLRPPEGEWVCLDSVTHVDGLGFTDTALWDERGRIGRAAQTLLVESADVDFRRVAYFKDADEVYQYIGKLFEQLAEDDELAPKFRKANTIVQYQYREPESQITVKLIEGEDGQVDCGSTNMEPEVVMTMDADTAHRFWLGKVNVTVALARGQMKAKGPVAKILKLVPLTKPVFPRYRALLEQDGREDLLEAA